MTDTPESRLRAMLERDPNRFSVAERADLHAVLDGGKRADLGRGETPNEDPAAMPEFFLGRYRQRSWLAEFGFEPEIVEAVQWTGADAALDAIQSITGGGKYQHGHLWVRTAPWSGGNVKISDWVVRCTNGDVFVMFDPYFRNRYVREEADNG